MELEKLASEAVDCAFVIHRKLGPGLLESVYEALMARSLETRGLCVERQKSISFTFEGIKFEDGLRVDLLVESKLLVELKSVECIAPVHSKQVLTYLRVLEMPLGLLINFGSATIKDNIRRIVNNHTDYSSSRLRIHHD